MAQRPLVSQISYTATAADLSAPGTHVNDAVSSAASRDVVHRWIKRPAARSAAERTVGSHGTQQSICLDQRVAHGSTAPEHLVVHPPTLAPRAVLTPASCAMAEIIRTTETFATQVSVPRPPSAIPRTAYPRLPSAELWYL